MRNGKIYRMVNRIYITIALLLYAGSHDLAMAADADTAFSQPVSVRYHLAGEIREWVLKKVVIDYNDAVHVLTDKGLCRIHDNTIVKDLLYRPLANKIPLDITAQETSGYLYYLYDSCFLTNAYAGVPYGVLPKGKYNKFAVAADGSVFLAGEDLLGIFKHGTLTTITPPADKIISVQADRGAFYLLCANGLYTIAGNEYKLIHRGSGLNACSFFKNAVVLGTSNGYYSIDRFTGTVTLPLQSNLPAPNISMLLHVAGKMWAGTPGGAFVEMAPRTFRYYASQRWLDNNDVSGMAADAGGNVYVLTPTGLNEIKFVRHTLLQKAGYFQQDIRQHHIRYGLLAELRMAIPGDLATAEMVDTDNDGLWSSFYLGSQAFRYAVTKDPGAKQYVWESFSAYERLISINQLKGFPSRTFERKGYKVSDPQAWRPSPDSGWEWKGTTSSDEFVGYIFIAAVIDQYVATTAEEKKRVAGFIDKILTHIIDNNYNFIDVDGKPTKWARWNPEYVNWYPKTIGDRKQTSTNIIAGLQLGYKLTGKNLYKAEALKLMYKYGYLDNIQTDIMEVRSTPGYIFMGDDMGIGPANHSDDEMTFLSYWVLYH